MIVEPGPELGPTSVVPAEDHASSRPDRDTMSPSSEAWWPRYRSALLSRQSENAVRVLEDDARYIVDRAMPGSPAGPETAAWPTSRVRTGMVVGSVQSGKTASMLGVAAMALDRGVNLVVLLAGTRVGLWLQTYERLLGQLDGSTPDNAFRRRAARLILPQPADILNEQRAEPSRYLQRPLARLALKAGTPIICVVPKEDDHLLMLRRFLQHVIDEPFLSARTNPFTMLLLDDEADDASVLDSENSLKVTPRLITALWSGDSDLAATRHEKLLASYVAYTATPQANYLQATHNPLSPRDFNAALRVPGGVGARHPRSLTFAEPAGVASYYCGGEIFYERLQVTPTAAFAKPSPFPQIRDNESQGEFEQRYQTLRWDMLSDALRSFLVGAAIRLHQSGRSLVSARDIVFETAEAARAASPSAHTMLHHPSARKGDHFSAAVDIVRWSLSSPGEEQRTPVPGEDVGMPELRLSAAGLAKRLEAEEETWRAWLVQFESTRIGLATLPSSPYPPITLASWPAVRRILLEEIFPNVAIRVLNSDPTSDDRPRFQPEQVAGGYATAPDLLSIFVAGNVLSRGLTLEGLATSLFLRGAAEPAADTQMQMQRWFGYRGPHLPFCRVLTFEDQLQLFRSYHVNDNALKTEIMKKMEGAAGDTASSILVLQGVSFLATSKVDSRKVPLSPGPRPSIRLVEAANSDLASANIDVLSDICNDGRWGPLADANGFERGIIRHEPIGLLRLADMLDRLLYAHHDPDPSNEFSQRWLHYEASIGLTAPLFRPPGRHPQPYAVEPQSCPYSIAAYLRLWESLRGDRHAPGFYPTDRPDVPWSYADASSAPGPHFYVAVRFGDQRARDPRLLKHGIRTMTRQLSSGNMSLQTLWGTRGYGGAYIGDELVDYYHHGTRPIPSLEGGATWRPRGHPGLVLFHVIRCDTAPNDLVAIGLGLPHGGPDHVAALRP
ncbi:hypothetical protein B5V02_21955 [Mesorhizobium kowhaii]|uniref:Putative endonuclease Z1 domain-containing protein n=2 Tax=Mesorhizobium kowhaii TaxID=1300272 RepID=A0A2W7DZ82_9HYPH|nr:hypothetical protein B5V02_21955 [Mesorhizobium kowhaii]